MASIRKRTWRTKAGEPRTAWLVDVLDRQGNRTAKQFTSLKEAKAYRSKIETEINRGVYRVEAGKMTVADAVDLWLKHCDKREGVDLEPGTVADYKVKAGHLKQQTVARMKLADVTTGVVNDLFLDMLENGMPMPTAKRVVSTLSAVFTYAMHNNWAALNPCAGRRTRVGARASEAVTPPDHETVKCLLDAAYQTDLGFGLYVRLAVISGLRASEQRGLRWGDLDLKAGTVTVGARLDRYNRRGDPKSRAGHRTIPLSPRLVAELRERKLRCGGREDMPVFTARGGAPFRHENLMRSRWYPVRQAAGCPEVNWHALRHYAISTWIEAGLTPKAVQVRAGHSSIRITFDRYGHLFPSSEAGAELAGIEARLDG